MKLDQKRKWIIGITGTTLSAFILSQAGTNVYAANNHITNNYEQSVVTDQGVKFTKKPVKKSVKKPAKKTVRTDRNTRRS